MSNIVLVPGAYHGAWYFSPILPQLRSAGHEVFALSLTGLEGPEVRPRMPINLDTHIEDVVSFIELEQLSNVVLCGHSYGGMVIAGVSGRLSERIRTLLFIDAMAPEDGDSVWSTFPPEARERFVACSLDGITTPAPPGVDPRARAHPLASFLQPVRLGEAAYAVPNKIYALCASDVGSPFYGIRDRLASNTDWTMRELSCGHDFMNEAPELALGLILEAAAV